MSLPLRLAEKWPPAPGYSFDGQKTREGNNNRRRGKAGKAKGTAYYGQEQMNASPTGRLHLYSL